MRVSTTTLESYRLYTEDVVPEEDLLASIRGEFKPSRATALGAALHLILEEPDRHYTNVDTYVCDGITFPGPVIRPCLERVLPDGVFEVKGTRDYQIGRDLVTVVGKVDQVWGCQVKEFKSRWDSCDVDRYARSFQWRFYLDVFGAAIVTYEVFLLSEHEDGKIALRGIETLPLYPYPALRAECEALLADFVAYAHLRGLEGFLQPRAA